MGATLTWNLNEEIEAELMLRRVGEVPRKIVNKAAGKGFNEVRKAVRHTVPVRTGALKKGIIRVGERSRTKGKKVYDLMFDPDKNSVFQKEIQHPGELGGKKWHHAYYPASQEYGFLARTKEGGVQYIEGLHFMRKGADSARPAAQKAIIQTVTREMEKEWIK